MSAADGTIIGATKIRDNGSDGKRWTVVLVAEGYRAADQPKFVADCQQFITFLVGTPPFDEMARGINAYRLDVTSVDAGADDPTTPPGVGTTVRTFFDATFNCCPTRFGSEAISTAIPRFRRAAAMRR